MNGRDMMPACARIAAVDPAMADRMWNTTTDDDGRDLVDERMRGKGRVLCAACPMRLDCHQPRSRQRLEGQGRVRRARLCEPLDPRPTDRP
ncbi:WhiB family transcriptional regulator [Bifidobacterium breve]|nr:WhiB family transcriptional regulator [Bifidobacterium breve]